MMWSIDCKQRRGCAITSRESWLSGAVASDVHTRDIPIAERNPSKFPPLAKTTEPQKPGAVCATLRDHYAKVIACDGGTGRLDEPWFILLSARLPVNMVR